MDISFAFDEGYADHAQVAIESILDCHQHRDDITFWLLTTSTVESERASSLDQQVRGRAQLRVLTSDDGFRAMPVAQAERRRYLSAGMYLRLFLPDLIPHEVRRLLYLDCDVLVSGDLGPLWDLSLGGAPLAAVRDGFTRTMGHSQGVPGAGRHVRGAAPYFNSGVMLINTSVWREMKVTERCLAYLTEYHEQLRFPDQDALNLATYRAWLRLEPRWNDTLLWLVRPDDKEIQDYVRVTHFIGPTKPWHDDFAFPRHRERYLALAARVPATRALVPG